MGSDLIADDRIDVEFRDDFSLIAKTVPGDIQATYIDGQAASTLYAGTVEDSQFGMLESFFYFQMNYRNSVDPEFEGAIFDSAVIMLDVLPGSIYGDSLATFDIEIYRLLEDISNADTVYSTDRFAVSDVPVATIEGVRPSDRDTLRITEPNSTTAQSFTNVVRTKFDRQFSFDLFGNTDAFGSNENLVSVFNGLMIKATSESNALLAFNLGTATSVTNNRIRVYYHTSASDSTIYKQHDYSLGFVRPQVYDQVYEGTPVAESFDQAIMGDAAGYIQGFDGPMLELDFTDILELKSQDVQINHAELEVTVAYSELGDTPTDPVNVLGLFTKDEDGIFSPVEDLRIGLFRNARTNVFGGDIEELERDLFEYSMNISAYIKEVLDGKQSGKVYLSVLDKAQNPNRTALYGPEHPTYPMKLKLTYTLP